MKMLIELDDISDAALVNPVAFNAYIDDAIKTVRSGEPVVVFNGTDVPVKVLREEDEVNDYFNRFRKAK